MRSLLLHEVTRARGTDVRPAPISRWRETFKDRRQPLHIRHSAADHQTVSLLQSPKSTNLTPIGAHAPQTDNSQFRQIVLTV